MRAYCLHSVSCRSLSRGVALGMCTYLAYAIYMLGSKSEDQSTEVDLPKSRETRTTGLWETPKLPEHLKDRDQTDPDLINHIRDNWIIPPFTQGRHIPDLGNKGRRGDYSEHGQPTLVDELLLGKTGGFVVECGAADGRRNSNSLFLELNRNWTGLLIEANPQFFRSILHMRRNMYMVDACLSTKKTPMVVNFSTAGISGGILDHISREQKAKYKIDDREPITVQCFPLYSILAALNISQVDYFSLDIEGAEVDVLKTIPFADITIEILSVEKRVLEDSVATAKREREIHKLLRPAGYKLEKLLKWDMILKRIG